MIEHELASCRSSIKDYTASFLNNFDSSNGSGIGLGQHEIKDAVNDHHIFTLFTLADLYMFILIMNMSNQWQYEEV